MPQRIFDTHIHIWKPGKGRYEWLLQQDTLLQQTYDITRLEEQRKAAGITDGILVQADNNLHDTNWMLETASETAWIKGVVGWLPLTDPSATARALDETYLHNKYFVGVRHLIHNEPDAKWLLQKKVLESLQMLADRGLVYEVVAVVPQHIETALRVADKIPGLKMVFDHLSQPPIASKEKFGVWGRLMGDAARHTNFYAKISGLGTASGNSQSWAANDLEPYIEFSLQHFGTDRCFCGGDWPVSLLAGSYTNTWQQYKKVLSKLLMHDDLEKVYHKNAMVFYNL